MAAAGIPPVASGSASSPASASYSAAAVGEDAPQLDLSKVQSDIKAGAVADSLMWRNKRTLQKELNRLEIGSEVHLMRGTLKKAEKKVKKVIASLKEKDITEKQINRIKKIERLLETLSDGRVEKWKIAKKTAKQAKKALLQLSPEDQAAALIKFKAEKIARLQENIQAMTLEIQELEKGSNIETGPLAAMKAKRAQIIEAINKNKEAKFLVLSSEALPAEKLDQSNGLEKEHTQLMNDLKKIRRQIKACLKELEHQKARDLITIKKMREKIEHIKERKMVAFSEIETLKEFIEEYSDGSSSESLSDSPSSSYSIPSESDSEKSAAPSAAGAAAASSASVANPASPQFDLRKVLSSILKAKQGNFKFDSMKERVKDKGLHFDGSKTDKRDVQKAINKLNKEISYLKEVLKCLDNGQIKKWEAYRELGKQAEDDFYRLSPQERSAELEKYKAEKLNQLKEKMKLKIVNIQKLKSANLDTSKLTELRDRKGEMASKLEEMENELQAEYSKAWNAEVQSRIENKREEISNLQDDLNKIEKEIKDLIKNSDPETKKSLNAYNREVNAILKLRKDFERFSKKESLDAFVISYSGSEKESDKNDSSTSGSD